MLEKPNDSNSPADHGQSFFPSNQAWRGLVIVTVTNRATVQILPIEIVYVVLQHAENAQLLSFALTCRRYQPEAERLLYKNIKFAVCDKYTQACLKTLAADPRKALSVQSFWMYWRQPLKGPTLKVATLKGAAYRLLGEALLAMTSLKVLLLRFHQNQSAPARTVMNSYLRYARGHSSSSR
jgi:hypothetical protein